MDCPSISRKSSKDEAAEERKREKRRAQNRNSQKLLREKQASYTRALERIVNNMETAAPQSTQTPSQLLQVMEELRTENNELRELALRMRKQFLSISTMASSSADDCILDSAVGAGRSVLDTSPKSNILPSECLTPVAQAMSAVPDPQVSPWPMPDPCTNVGYIPSRDTSNPNPSPNQHPQGNAIIATPSTSSLDPNLQANSYENLELSARRVDGLTCNMYGVQKFFRMENSVKKMMAEMEEVGGLSDERVSQVLGPAIRLMMKKSPLEGWIDASGSPNHIEKIVKWRILPTFENRENILQPFTPTVLQQHFTNRHPYVDFIPWGELRDQILLYSGDLDMTQLLEDLIHNYVQEVPGLSVALPVLDTYRELLKQYTAGVAGLPPYGGFQDEDDDPEASVFYAVTSVFRRYGLDKYAERKLDPSFSQKYPVFDVEKIVTKVPVLSYSAAIANKG